MKKLIIVLSGVFIFGLYLGSSVEKTTSRRAPGEQSPVLQNSTLKAAPYFGRMPLHFILNQGQLDKQVAYYVEGKDKSIYFTSGGLTIVLSDPSLSNGNPDLPAPKGRLKRTGREYALGKERTKRWVIKLDFIGADPGVRPAGKDKTQAAVSYFKGQPGDWHTGVPTYSKIVYSNLWPGIDLVYSGTYNQMKYEFILRPGADPSKIRLAYRGTDDVKTDEDGRLEVSTPLGGFRDETPVAYQEIDGKRVDVPLAYDLDSQGNDLKTKSFAYGFKVGDCDRTHSLVLDPAVLVYCGYIGGTDYDSGRAIAVDGSGNAYVTGQTMSTGASFPEAVGPDLISNGSTDAFVAKINATGTALIYCGFIGGSLLDMGSDIAVDGSGNAYIVGTTYSDQTSFPVLAGPDLTFNGGTYDAFVAKVNTAGTALVYCGYIGGANWDSGQGIAVDNLGNAYVAGTTWSNQASFPVAVGPDLIYHGNHDAFVAKVKADGKALVYCGYIGGDGMETGNGIAVDSLGSAYVTGSTNSDEATFPVTAGPDLTYNGGLDDAYVAKVKANGTGFVYCGFIGGSDVDYGQDMAVDGSGNAYITGYTRSTEPVFPVIVGPDLSYNGGTYDAFAAKVNTGGSALVYCGYIGGTAADYGYGIAVDGSGNAYITGWTDSAETSFPVAHGPDLIYNGSTDAFVAKINSNGSTLGYCGYIGGAAADFGWGVAADSSGNVYIAGETSSAETDFPVIGGPDSSFNGGGDAFVVKINQKEDLIGTWDGQGVYFRNSMTGNWINMATPAEMIAAGDIDGDGRDDLIGTWPGQQGVWIRYSKTGAWSKLSSTAKHVASGDMNGDGRVDFLGTWDGQGVYYKNSISGTWTKIASPATLITAGDFDGDGKDDLIGIWPTQGGVWVHYSKTGAWAKLSETARDIAAGDMNGDGTDDLLGTWIGQGVYYRNSVSGAWVKMSVPGEQVTAGDLDGDGTDDLIGLWSGQGGIWVKCSKTGAWSKLSTPAKDIAAGAMRGAIWGANKFGFLPLDMPAGGYAEGPPTLSRYKDLSSEGPGGWRFAAQGENNLIPQESGKIQMTPGPGEPGFICIEQQNLIPQEQEQTTREKSERETWKYTKRHR